MPDPAPPRKARISRKALGTGCGRGRGRGPGWDPGWNSDCGSGGPRRSRVGRLSPGLGGEPACRAPNSEPESGPRRAGDAGDAGGAEGAEGAGLPWIPNGDSLRQQSRPNAFPLQRAAGEGSETGGRKAPPVRRPQLGVSPRDPAKDPARHGSNPRPDPCHRLDLQPLRRHELFGTPLRERSKKILLPPVTTKKINAPTDAAKTGHKCHKSTQKR